MSLSFSSLPLLRVSFSGGPDEQQNFPPVLVSHKVLIFCAVEHSYKLGHWFSGHVMDVKHAIHFGEIAHDIGQYH